MDIDFYMPKLQGYALSHLTQKTKRVNENIANMIVSM